MKKKRFKKLMHSKGYTRKEINHYVELARKETYFSLYSDVLLQEDIDYNYFSVFRI